MVIKKLLKLSMILLVIKKEHLDCIFSFNLVGEERIELSLLAKHDFESCASTSSAIRPKK